MNTSFGNVIRYPENIKCECGKEVVPMIGNIDTSTWDLKCKCGRIAYRHPEREKRKEQLENMLL